jgi:hypothetical protein
MGLPYEEDLLRGVELAASEAGLRRRCWNHDPDEITSMLLENVIPSWSRVEHSSNGPDRIRCAHRLAMDARWAVIHALNKYYKRKRIPDASSRGR